MRKLILLVLGVFVLLILVGVQLFFTPAVQRRVAALRTDLHYLLNPPDQVALISEERVAAVVQATLEALAHTHTPSAVPSFTPLPEFTATSVLITPTPTLTPFPSATPPPPALKLNGIRHEWQTFNNCGPANVAMILSYWGWQGDQSITRAALRPHPDDANVMPAEMVAYIENHTNLRALARTGGNIDLLKRLVAGGFPVLIEIGHHPSDDWWMGHYLLASGYDDTAGIFVTQDSLIQANLPKPYAELDQHWWRDFNHIYLVAYPPEREPELFSILGPDADAVENTRRTLATADAEIPHLSERDLFFALFNRGAALLVLGQPQEAASAFDTAFAVYDSLKKEQRPWRILWYRTEAYQAYYEAGRYQSTIDLTDAALSMLSKRGLEESHYWRGLAYAALGQHDLARQDLQLAVTLRPGYAQAEQALQRLDRNE
jgi:hypothetical protein